MRYSDANENGGLWKRMEIATLVVVVMVIVTALIFDFTNGFHDTANARPHPSLPAL